MRSSAICGAAVSTSIQFFLLISQRLVADSSSEAYGPTIRDTKSGKLVFDNIDAK